MTARQLGELLYRCARTRRTFHIGDVEHVSRPYPSGGGVYELELYPVIRRVSGLDAGMYHYESVEHRLRLVREPGPHVEALLRVAASAAMTSAQPQALLVIAARFGRLAYTYEEIPYSLVLKHTGVLYQSIYLVATAMGLAPCGLGGGDVMAFAAATGRDIRQESAVGEFMLGSRIDDVTAQGDAGEPVAST
jgi:SagB-type dehydrogenase family enzyme